MTDHSKTIKALREEHSINCELAADLLEMHDNTGLSLDNWGNARVFVETCADAIEADYTFQPNGA